MDVEAIPFPWENQPEEGDRAYAAFQLYRDSFPNTSTAAVARELSKSEQLIRRWAAKHRWIERAQAWVAEKDRRRREAFIQESAEMARRQATEAASMSRVLMQPAQAIIRQLSGEDAAEVRKRIEALPIDDQLRLAIQAARVWPLIVNAERLARGQATARIDFTAATDEQASVASDEERLGKVFAALESAGITPHQFADSMNGEARSDNGHG